MVLLAFSATLRAEPTERRVQLNGDVYQLPTHYFSDSNDLLDTLRASPGLDADRIEVLLAIPADEVASLVPGYVTRTGEYVDDLRLRIVALSSVEVKRYADSRRFAELKDGTGSYHDRIVEFDPNEGLTNVYRRAEYPRSRQVFQTSLLPNGRIGDPDATWLASCIDAYSSLTPRKRLSLCKGYVVIDHIALHFTTSDANLLRVPQIKRMLDDMLRKSRTR